MNHYKSLTPNHLKYIEKLDNRNKIASTKMFLLEEYTRSHDKLLFGCERGHITSVVAYSVTNGTRCAICSGKKKRTTEEYVSFLFKNTKWKLLEGEQYVNSTTKLKVVCERGHIRELSPGLIISQNVGCAICNKKGRKTTEQFIEELYKKLIKDDRPIIQLKDDQNYINNRTPLIFVCKNNHEWTAEPAAVLYSSGCPICARTNYSQQAIRWLKEIERSDGINIQHAENGGEFLIPKTRFSVDGYCKETNTVYEFHGNKFHGNLKIYKPTDNCHPFDKEVTALELYEKTIRREQMLLDIGYTLVVKWEDI